MANILMVTHWTDGDVLPFIEIGKAMLKQNHKVTLFTHCFYREKAVANGLGFEALDTEAQYLGLIEDMKREIDPFRDWGGFLSFQNKYESREVRLNEFKKISSHIVPGETIIIAKNRSSVAAFLAAENDRIPLVNIFMNPVEIPNMLIFNQHFGSKMLPELNELRNTIGLPPVTSWLAFQSMPGINIALWPEWYTPQESRWPQHITYVGFMVSPHKREVVLSDTISAMLKSVRTKVLITGGTSKMIHPEFYSSSILACAQLEYPAVVVTRYPELLPSHLPDNIAWINEVPLREFIPEFNIVIHHGGIGTATNALEAAVPQLVLPYYVDRPFNGACIQALGVGFSVPPKDWKQEILSNYLLDLKRPEIKLKCERYSAKVKLESAIGEISRIVEESLKCNQYPEINNLNVHDIVQNPSSDKETQPVKHDKNKKTKMMLLKKIMESSKIQGNE